MTVLLAMSGGVDSSMVAFILKNQGYDIIGAHIKLWQDQENETQNEAKDEENWDNMLLVADKLKFPIYEFDLRDEFKNSVVNYFLTAHQKGLTPNPCIVCNQKIKFGLLMDKMKELNCDYLATGHYTKILHQANNYYLQAGDDKTKDQSYFLYHLQANQLAHILFPLGDKKKSEIKIMAQNYGLINIANRKESQGLCFLSEDSYIPFLQKNIPHIFKTGNIIYHNEIIGTHQGLPYYTIGQRRGIDIGGFLEPIYVIGFDFKQNQLIMGDNQELFTKHLKAHSFILTGTNQDNINQLINQPLLARIRHLGHLITCQISSIKNDNILGITIKVIFTEPIRAITPGQTITFYNDEGIVIGGGEIY